MNEKYQCEQCGEEEQKNPAFPNNKMCKRCYLKLRNANGTVKEVSKTNKIDPSISGIIKTGMEMRMGIEEIKKYINLGKETS